MIAKIKTNEMVGPDYYQLKLIAPDISRKGQPGQFVHLKVRTDENTFDPLLRRPFSIHDIDCQKGLISLIYRVTGKGTEILSGFNPGRKVDLLGPLGSGFRLDLKAKDILVIGGGMGIIPLYYLVKKLDKESNRIKVLLGGGNWEEIKVLQEMFTSLGIEPATATMDGSDGYKGTVIDLWQDEYINLQSDFIYSCGPTPMLQAVQKIAGEYQISGQVSLEERMGCGIGVCLSCVCETVEGNKRLCQEGPVLDLGEVIFDESK